MKIEFLNFSEFENFEPPVPASKILPEWYKNIDSYYTKEKKVLENVTTSTIKRCMPVFDSLTSGYIIKTASDLYVEKRENNQDFYIWPVFESVSFHLPEQVAGHPKINTSDGFAPKIQNLWGIKTPKGYSCLIISPFHLNPPITILTGIVDTDKYNLPIHFPFILTDKNFSGLIPCGTPIAQIVPFKRDDWKMFINKKQHKLGEHKDYYTIFKTFFNRYKNNFWTKKHFL